MYSGQLMRDILHVFGQLLKDILYVQWTFIEEYTVCSMDIC
jgi:hypothetical protein